MRYGCRYCCRSKTNKMGKFLKQIETIFVEFCESVFERGDREIVKCRCAGVYAEGVNYHRLFCLKFFFAVRFFTIRSKDIFRCRTTVAEPQQQQH